jgi:transglutaminase-like putative cysteine protease
MKVQEPAYAEIVPMASTLAAPSSRRAPLDWATFVALLLLVLVSAYCLAAADWADHLAMVPTVAALAVLAGTGLARSRFPGWSAAALATAYGLFLVTFLAAITIEDVYGIHDQLVALGGRFGAFEAAIAAAEPNTDPLMFVVLMLALYWIIGVVASYVTIRNDTIWPALLLPGIALLVNTFYYLRRPGLDGYVAIYTLAAVALVFVVNLDRHRREWQATGSRVPSNASGQITQIGLLLTFLLVTLAWLAPKFAQSERAADVWESATRPWIGFRQRLTRAFTGLRNPVAIVSDVFGSEMRLAAGIAPSETPIFTATILGDAADGMRLYWRARTYDTYSAGTWTSLETDVESYFPDEGSFPLPAYSGRRTVEISVYPEVESMHLLYTPAQPSGINRSSLLTVVRTPSGVMDVSSVAARTTVVLGEVYRLRGEVADPTADQLRSAGTEYPAWVRERFLQLPETLTPRTGQLAIEITRDLGNPYDEAAAITRWLRNNIEYSLASAEPPEGVEPIDWFLFDHGIGFCNWYASAEVLLLRSLGIPARVAVGFAQGTVDESGRIYSVLQRDAHAWPEVFFPGFGWVEFEPTTAQPPLERVEVVVPSEGEEGMQADAVPGLEDDMRDLRRLLGGRVGGEFEEGPEIPVTRPSPMPWIVAAVGALAIGALWWMLDPVARSVTRGALGRSLARIGVKPPARWATYEAVPLTAIARVYWRWSTGLERIGIPTQASQTPFERGRAFADRYPLEAEHGWAIARSYAAERYGGLKPDPAPVSEAWRALGPWMALLWIEKAPAQALRRRAASLLGEVEPSP